MSNNGDLPLGTIKGVKVSIDDTLSLLDKFADDDIIGDLDGETITVGDFRHRLLRLSAMPKMVPMEDRISDKEWAEAVFDRGEAPYGRCAWCRTAKGAAGCLNLCDMPAAAAQDFTNGIMNHLNERRAQTAWLEALGGCTCGPARLTGYAVERDRHDHRCPMG
jgi:hypothetical protein